MQIKCVTLSLYLPVCRRKLYYTGDQIVPSLASERLYKLAFSPFSRTSGVLASFLAFQYDKVLLAHLIYFLPQICNQALLWGPLVPLSSKLNIPIFNSF